MRKERIVELETKREGERWDRGRKLKRKTGIARNERESRR